MEKEKINENDKKDEENLESVNGKGNNEINKQNR